MRISLAIILLGLFSLPTQSATWETVQDKREIHYRAFTEPSGMLDIGCSLTFNVLLDGNMVTGASSITNDFLFVINGKTYPNYLSADTPPPTLDAFVEFWELLRTAKTLTLLMGGQVYLITTDGLSSTLPELSRATPAFPCRPINTQGALLQ